MALVSQRLRALCLAPQLLRSLTVSVTLDRSAFLPAATAALQFLTAHAAHVRQLDFNIESYKHRLALQYDAERRELEAAVAGCLAACATAGCLQHLRIGSDTALHSMAWLPALRQLQTLELGNEEQTLQLPAAVTRLTALQEASLTCDSLYLNGRLPPSLTRLGLREIHDESELPREVSAGWSTTPCGCSHGSRFVQSACLDNVHTHPPFRTLQVTRLSALASLKVYDSFYGTESLSNLSCLR